MYKFYQAYDETQNGPKWYMNGVGRDDLDSGIQINWFDDKDANTAHARIDYMLQQLDDYMAKTTFQEGEAVNIDIVGFSRSAAMSRDFTNRVATRLKTNAYKDSGACAQIRFLGLWDTVAQFGLNGADNGARQLAIPPEAKNVFQAVALNEHRENTARKLPDSFGAFPLESIVGGTVPAEDIRIERGFIGSHADIGGGFGEDENQLSQVALTWMVNQAVKAGLKMGDSPLLRTIVANPVIHDKSDNQYSSKGAPVAPVAEDREVHYRDGSTTTQMAMTGTGMTWADTQGDGLISYLPPDGPFIDGEVTRVPRADYVTGTVNMKKYLEWLGKSDYGIKMTVSGQ